MNRRLLIIVGSVLAIAVLITCLALGLHSKNRPAIVQQQQSGDPSLESPSDVDDFSGQDSSELKTSNTPLKRISSQISDSVKSNQTCAEEQLAPDIAPQDNSSEPNVADSTSRSSTGTEPENANCSDKDQTESKGDSTVSVNSHDSDGANTNVDAAQQDDSNAGNANVDAAQQDESNTGNTKTDVAQQDQSDAANANVDAAQQDESDAGNINVVVAQQDPNTDNVSEPKKVLSWEEQLAEHRRMQAEKYEKRREVETAPGEQQESTDTKTVTKSASKTGKPFNPNCIHCRRQGKTACWGCWKSSR